MSFGLIFIVRTYTCTHSRPIVGLLHGRKSAVNNNAENIGLVIALNVVISLTVIFVIFMNISLVLYTKHVI